MGEVNILNPKLLLPKGEDIRMVYNGTYSGMYTSLWDPHSAIPMVGSTLCAVEKGKIYGRLGHMRYVIGFYAQ